MLKLVKSKRAIYFFVKKLVVLDAVRVAHKQLLQIKVTVQLSQEE